MNTKFHPTITGTNVIDGVETISIITYGSPQFQNGIRTMFPTKENEAIDTIHLTSDGIIATFKTVK